MIDYLTNLPCLRHYILFFIFSTKLPPLRGFKPPTFLSLILRLGSCLTLHSQISLRLHSAHKCKQKMFSVPTMTVVKPYTAIHNFRKYLYCSGDCGERYVGTRTEAKELLWNFTIQSQSIALQPSLRYCCSALIPTWKQRTKQ